MAASIPGPEYAPPDLVRAGAARRLNLNGEWHFELDPGLSGIEGGLSAADRALSARIAFCRESRLSAFQTADFVRGAWHRGSRRVPGA